MANEVSMKDLQSLQGYVNKKVAELDGKIDSNWKQLSKDQLSDVQKLEKRLDQLEKNLEGLSKNLDSAIEQINAGFKSLTKRIDDLSAK
jgi:DNA anti-recombination protein RmuC